MKKIIMSIIVAIICISLCTCGKAKSEDRHISIQMKINIEEATLYLSDSNKAVITSVYAMKANDDEESIVECFKEALELEKAVKARVDASISFPNFISKELEELKENYEKTTILLSRLSELSEEEIDELLNLMKDGTSKNELLYKALYAFSYLYEIRYFDKLPDAEAQSALKDSWWKFGFNDIECPETIDVQELYLIWARQFFGEFDEDKFLAELQILRENDDLSSPECNQKWTDFIEIFISKT